MTTYGDVAIVYDSNRGGNVAKFDGNGDYLNDNSFLPNIPPYNFSFSIWLV